MSYPHASCLLLSLSLILLTPLSGLSEQPVSRTSPQQSSPSKLIPPRPFTVNKETMDHLARTPLNVPNSLSGQEHQALREIAGQIKANDAKSATIGWSTLVNTLGRKNIPVDINELIAFVLRESYLQTSRDLKNHADKVKSRHDQIAEARREIANLRDQLARLPSGKPDLNAVKRAALTKSLRQWEEKLSKLNDDAELANIDMQKVLQKQQQTLQMISNISKQLHDTAMAIIRNIK